MATGYPPRVWPRPAGAGQCLLVWSAYNGPVEETRTRIDRYAASELAVPADGRAREGTIDAPYTRSRRTYRIHYALYDTPQGECR
jgi:hypothetical protein